MMRKKTNYTHITPIPSFIPRQLAIDILHSHGEIIELNPLVLRHEPIKAPRDAPADEFYATWYEITERIQYVPGIGKLGSGVIKFKGCFHDMPWGLQTHTYAPAGVDIRNKWQICGNQPGEPPQQQELGLGAPPEGLYMREDIEIKCNVTMVGFVKKEMKAASKIMVERLTKKAELLDAGVLQAMMHEGKLKTINPADRSVNPGGNSPQPSPNMAYNMPMSPSRSPTFPHNQLGPQPQKFIPPGNNNIVMELPGDFYHAAPTPGHLQPNDNRYSVATTDGSGYSPNPSDGMRWSTVSHDQSSISSRPSSYAPSESGNGVRSPGLEQKAFAAELPTMEETREEHDARKQHDSQQQDQKYRYNPQDFVNPQQYSQPPQYVSYNNQQGR